MDLKIKNRLFIVTGATAGFGKAVTSALVNEKAKVIINGRDKEKLSNMEETFHGHVEGVFGDISSSRTIKAVLDKIRNRKLDGIFVNAGGPPAKSFIETDLDDWDTAYKNLLRWKVEIIKALLPTFINQNYGRILFLESCSVKQPVENLVLSNSIRLAVIGFAKTLSLEVAKKGITVNTLAPGYHKTSALERLFVKKSQVNNISYEEAEKQFEKEPPVGKIGDPDDLASLALWFLSPLNEYITGQTISVDGGLIKSTMG